MIRSGVLLLLSLLLVLYLFGVQACAADLLANKQQEGRVQLVGSIVDTGCAMRMGNEGQTVTFQPASLDGLVRGEASFQRPLNIYLSDCGITYTGSNALSSRALKLTFEGEVDGNNFSLQGAVKGIALRIKDARGKLIAPGMLLDDSSGVADTMVLNYVLELVGTGSALQAGNYHATIKLSIQHYSD